MNRDAETFAERYVECMNKCQFIIEALRDEQVHYDVFCKLVELAMNDLIALKRDRLEKAREQSQSTR